MITLCIKMYVSDFKIYELKTFAAIIFLETEDYECFLVVFFFVPYFLRLIQRAFINFLILPPKLVIMTL